MATGLWWVDNLNQILSTKPAEVVQEACQVLEKHGFGVKEELKSELYHSSTLCQAVFKYCNMPTCSLAGVAGIE